MIKTLKFSSLPLIIDRVLWGVGTRILSFDVVKPIYSKKTNLLFNIYYSTFGDFTEKKSHCLNYISILNHKDAF